MNKCVIGLERALVAREITWHRNPRLYSGLIVLQYISAYIYNITHQICISTLILAVPRHSYQWSHR